MHVDIDTTLELLQSSRNRVQESRKATKRLGDALNRSQELVRQSQIRLQEGEGAAANYYSEQAAHYGMK